MSAHVMTTLLGCLLPFAVFGIGPAIAYAMQRVTDGRQS